MAAYILSSDGNASASIFGTVDATSYLNSETNNTLLTTAYVESQAFSPGAITIDGIAIKVAARAASPTATISVRLAQAGATVAGTEVTINVSDIPYGVGLSASVHNGWIFFKFAAPVTLLGATPYTVSAKTSATNHVHLYRNATAGNWSRMLRTTTLATPGAGDTLHVLGEWTAAATVTTRTLTWDITAATDYGDTSTTIASVTVGIGGTITYGTAAATNYVMRVSGLVDVCVGGTCSAGTTGTKCPADSSMVMEFDCAADGDFGLRVYGAFNGQAPERLAGVTNHYVLLNTDEAGGSTALGTDGQLSALNGDTIAIASTTRTAADAETVALSADAGASSLSCAAIANAHSGTSPTQAEVIGLDRHVIVRSVSSTFMAYVLFADTGTVDCDWVEFRYLGSTSTNKRGVEIQTESGACSLNKCSFRDFDSHGIYISGSHTGWEITDCVFSKVGHQTASHAAINVSAATTGTWTITGNVIISDNTSAGQGINLVDLGGVCSNNRISSGGGAGLRISEANGFLNGTISGNVIHSMTGEGVLFQSGDHYGGVISNTTIWRCNSFGVEFESPTHDLLFDTLTIFGCLNASIQCTTNELYNVTFRDLTSSGDTTFATTSGFRTNARCINVRFEQGDFSTVSGIKAAHTTADIEFQTGADYCSLVLVDCSLGAATEVTGTSNLFGRSVIQYQRHEGSSGTNRAHYLNVGTVSRDTVTIRTSPSSEKLEPASASVKLYSERKRVIADSGETINISVYVNKGAGYNGSSPRLRVVENAAAGIAEATVDTHASAAGSWEQLTGSVGPVAEDAIIEFYVDVDGTAGQVNVQDWGATVA